MRGRGGVLVLLTVVLVPGPSQEARGGGRRAIFRSSGIQSQNNQNMEKYSTRRGQDYDEFDKSGLKSEEEPLCDEICLARKYALQAPQPQQSPCVGRCYVMKRDKLRTDKHLERMIDNWRLRRSCVGICHLIRLKMKKDKKFRRSFQEKPAISVTDLDVDYREYDLQLTTMGYTIETTTGQPPVTDPSIYSRLLWNSFLRKIESKPE